MWCGCRAAVAACWIRTVCHWRWKWRAAEGARITDEVLEHISNLSWSTKISPLHRGKRKLKAEVLERQQKDLVRQVRQLRQLA